MSMQDEHTELPTDYTDNANSGTKRARNVNDDDDDDDEGNVQSIVMPARGLMKAKKRRAMGVSGILPGMQDPNTGNKLITHQEGGSRRRSYRKSRKIRKSRKLRKSKVRVSKSRRHRRSRRGRRH